MMVAMIQKNIPRIIPSIPSPTSGGGEDVPGEKSLKRLFSFLLSNFFVIFPILSFSLKPLKSPTEIKEKKQVDNIADDNSVFSIIVW